MLGVTPRGRVRRGLELKHLAGHCPTVVMSEPRALKIAVQLGGSPRLTGGFAGSDCVPA